ncbi:MAG: hypothetical protein FIA95_11445, partial [Gemmatimonadetes bacterium]|nr:hypothetical protein [Gemmatimonadota bacterium]
MGTTGSAGPGVGEWLFRLALRALPRAFRDRYGEELLAFHRDRLREAGGSLWAPVTVWASAIRDLAQGALLERAREARKRLGGSRPSSPGAGVAFDLLLQDLRFALRGLARAPGFTSIAVLSLAVGIGAFAATFAVVQETWLKPVPGVTHADEVIEILVSRHGSELDAWSYPDFEDVGNADTPVRSLVGWKDREGTLGTVQGGERVRMMSVSADYFRTLGVALTQGRDFSGAEDQGPGQHPVVIVSYEMWRDRLGGDPGILGRVLTLNQAPYTVVGVAPREFRDHRILKSGTEVWVPLAQDPSVAGADPLTDDRGFQWRRVLGRLEPGATVEQANAAVEGVCGRLAEANLETNEGRSARAYAFGPIPAIGRAESLLGISVLFGLLGLALLIICGNVTGMVLARSVAREQELAGRMALGCGRRSLARL